MQNISKTESELLLKKIEDYLKQLWINSTYVNYGSSSKRKGLKESLEFEYNGYKIVIEIHKDLKIKQ